MVTSTNFCGSDVVGMAATRPSDNPRKKEKEKLTLVECVWIDAYTEASWSEYDASDSETKTYGLLVDQTAEWTTLAMSRDSSFWGNLWYIPTKNVVSLREIEDVTVA